MKTLLDVLKESRTRDIDKTNYVKSWLREDRYHYTDTVLLIMESMMDFFREEEEYFDDNQDYKKENTKEYKMVQDLRAKLAQAYKAF